MITRKQINSNMKSIVGSIQYRAWEAVRNIHLNISDDDVVDLYKYCSTMEEDPKLFANVMYNLYNVTEEFSLDRFGELFKVFYGLVKNNVIKQLEYHDLTLEEISEYRYGLGRNLLCLSRLIEYKVIHSTLMRDILVDSLNPIWIGVAFEDYILWSGKFEDEDDSTIVSAISTVIDNNSKMVEEYRNGKDKVIGALIGQVMKIVKGDAATIKNLLIRRINENS